MPTRRKRPVLYEIVRHTRRSSDVGWRDKRARTEAQKGTGIEPLRASPAGAPPSSATPTSAPPRAAGDLAGQANSGAANPGGAANAAGWANPAGTASSGGATPAGTEPSVRFVDGRLLLDLAWPGMTVGAVIAVVLLALAFQIGKRCAEPARPASGAEKVATAEAADPAALLPREIRPGAAGAPVHRTVENVPVAVPPSRAVEPAPRAMPPEPPPEQDNQPAFAFKPGYDYVVAQYFPLQHKETAFDAARFLQANGVDAVVLVKKADIEVVATEPFLLRQKDRAAKAAAQKACDTLKERIRTLGREFAKQQAAARKPQYALDQPVERLRVK